MSSLIAWSPVSESNGPLIFSVQLHPQQKLDTLLYLGLLSDRVQGMLDRSQDQSEASNQLQDILESGGVWPGRMKLREGSEANDLVASNPSLLRRLRQLGLPQNLQDSNLVEQLSAKQQILVDKAEPRSRLESWASAVSQMR